MAMSEIYGGVDMSIGGHIMNDPSHSPVILV